MQYHRIKQGRQGSVIINQIAININFIDIATNYNSSRLKVLYFEKVKTLQ